MAQDSQTLLDAIEDLILKRIRGDAYIEYSSAVQRFRGTDLKDLMTIRDNLKEQVTAEQGGSFSLGRMFRD